jgi:DNA end-binding protein Ku
MARAIWSGAISFGLVMVPVKVYSAVSRKDVRFNQLHAADGGRIQQKRVCSLDGEEVPYEEIVKGYEIEDGKYVMLTDEELAAAAPEKTRTIDIEEFVEVEDIDPIFYDHPYFLVPTGGEGGARAYVLLREVMEREGRAALGRFVLRNKEYLAAVRPRDGALTLTTMVFADEIRPTDPIAELIGDAKAPKNEVDAAVELIDAMSTDWDPQRYHDHYRERLLKVIEAKAEGATIEAPEEEEVPSEVPDLMAALEATLAEAKADGTRAKPKDRKKAKAAS